MVGSFSKKKKKRKKEKRGNLWLIGAILIY